MYVPTRKLPTSSFHTAVKVVKPSTAQIELFRLPVTRKTKSVTFTPIP